MYIPILPERLLDILQAPVPYLIGIDQEVLSLAERQQMISNEVVQVDLDENAIMCEPSLAAKMHLPQKQFHKLYKAIAPYCRPPSVETAGVPGGNASSAFPMAPPPDLAAEEHRSQGLSVSEMSEAQVVEAIATIKAAFLRFFVSMMMKYQDLMVVPPADIHQPSAVDFFDLKKWSSRFSGPCTEWLDMFASSQAFTQFLEQRLAPRDVPLLEVCFFNESIDAKLMRSKTSKFFGKHATPLLTSGVMPAHGYSGPLVPAAVRTVYNASMIAARPTRSQQRAGLLLVLGSGLQEHDQAQVRRGLQNGCVVEMWHATAHLPASCQRNLGAIWCGRWRSFRPL